MQYPIVQKATQVVTNTATAAQETIEASKKIYDDQKRSGSTSPTEAMSNIPVD
jgi:hypothetical protein